jgi:oligoendopeptidase F
MPAQVRRAVASKAGKTSKSNRKAAGQAAGKPAKSAKSAKAGRALGALPEWNLTDLYPAIDAPEVKRDLDHVDAECLEFEKAYRGRLAEIAAGPDAGAQLTEAIRRYEALDDLIGRLASYAGLVHAGDTTDPVRSKFYGDVQERITAASTRPCSTRRSRIIAPGSRTSARRSRTSSRTGSSSCSTRSR